MIDIIVESTILRSNKMTVEVPLPDRAAPKLPKKDHRMYLPAVYRYSCQGAFSASSLDHGSTGHCRGVRSQMEHLLDMNPSTRAEAITNFTGEGVDVDDDVGLIEDGRPNPALVYPPSHAPTTPAVNKDMEEIEDDTKILRETWTAFGSTEVECLQLTDLKTGRTEIVAVSPYNAALVSSRRIEMKDRTVSSTELGIGPYKMQFLIESGVMRDDLDSTSSPLENKKVEDKDEKTTNRSTNEMPDTAIIPTMENAQEFYTHSAAFLGKMYTFSGKIVDKMHSNANWLYGNLQDDFPARTAASGRKIIEQMPKTVDLFKKVFKQMCGFDDGDDDR